jgi:DNA-directed RNA polymerase subunit M/transcription elongation factor TFIIS
MLYREHKQPPGRASPPQEESKMDRKLQIALDKYLTTEHILDEEWDETDEVVEDGMECPKCGEARHDWLICQDDDTVKCATCGHIYELKEVIA